MFTKYFQHSNRPPIRESRTVHDIDLNFFIYAEILGHLLYCHLCKIFRCKAINVAARTACSSSVVKTVGS